MSKCFKCEEAYGTIPSRDGAKRCYCADCFTSFFTKNVKQTLFQQCMLPLQTPVAVAVSGGANSLALLHQLLILNALQELRGGAVHTSANTSHCKSGSNKNNSESNKKMNFHFLPFYLDERDLVVPPPPLPRPQPAAAAEGTVTAADAWEKTNIEREDARCKTLHAQFDNLESILKFLPSQWSFAGQSLFFTQGNDKKEIAIQRFSYAHFFSSEELAQLRSCLHPLPPPPGRSPSAVLAAAARGGAPLNDREMLYDRLKRLVLCLCAHECIDTFYSDQATCEGGESTDKRWYYMLTGDNGIRCAARALLALVLEGGGACVAPSHLVQLASSRGLCHNTLVLRPMRQMLPREAVAYNLLHGIPVSGYTPQLHTFMSGSQRKQHSIFFHVETFLQSQLAYTCNSGSSTNHNQTIIFNILNMVHKLEVEPEEMRHIMEGNCHLLLSPNHDDNSNNNTGKTLPMLGTIKNSKNVKSSPKFAEEQFLKIKHVPAPFFSYQNGNNKTDNNYNNTLLSCALCGFAFPLESVMSPSLFNEEDEKGERAMVYCSSCLCLQQDIEKHLRKKNNTKEEKEQDEKNTITFHLEKIIQSCLTTHTPAIQRPATSASKGSTSSIPGLTKEEEDMYIIKDNE